VARLIEGTSVSASRITDANERVDWEEFRAVMHRARSIWGEDELIALGASSVSGAVVRFIGVVGRLLFTPADFYRWVGSPDGVGSQMMTCVRSSWRDLQRGSIVIELRMHPGYAPCDELFLVSLGTFRAMPEMLGRPPAEVRMERLVDGALYHIGFDQRMTVPQRIRHAVAWPLAAASAARELKSAHEALEKRYADLEVARTIVERQRVLLDTAYRVGQAIWGEREPRTIGEAVVRSLVELAEFGGAEIVATSAQGQLAGARFGATQGDVHLEADLTGLRVRGRMQVWLVAGADPEAAETLLRLLAPTVALAVDNAFAYRELALYQEHLEQLVAERTSELLRARDDLAETVGQLREASAARERIFANISHEIRTPLSLILLAVADVEARATLDVQARGDLDSVVDSARKLLRLVDELLLLAAGQEAALSLAPASTDLARLVIAIATTWRPAAEAAGLTLRCEAPAALAAMIDPVALERVITNLLSNAVKFTPPGGRVSIALTRSDVGIRLAVRDTGVGIDDELLPRLFGRFERAKLTRRGGSGIGLSLVKDLVAAHGGEVGVERIPEGGTEIWITLPDVARATIEGAGEVAPRLRPADYGVVATALRSGEVLTPTKRSAATILVAEDDPRLAQMIARLLATDYTVVVALDGVAALALARQHQPHLLVTDVEMPGMTGLELTRRFREVTGNNLAPVVILSARADLGDRLDGFAAGAIDYVSKPFDPGELIARVQAQLGMRELALRLHRAEQLSALGTLSAGLAHELRNPANAIVNAVGPIKRLLPPELVAGSQPVGQLLDVLAGCAEQIGMLSRQLLSFRRAGELELRTIPLDDVIQRATLLAQPALQQLTLRTSIVVDGLVRCSPPLLVQVLANLLENAAHAAGAGGWIELAATTSGDLLLIEVADSGPGVPHDLRDRVFEPFFTTKAPGAGTGLGLPLARDIVHRHGGVLEIRDRDRRPVFVIELPHPTPPAATETPRREQEPPR